jgi:hypothetical protein
MYFKVRCVKTIMHFTIENVHITQKLCLEYILSKFKFDIYRKIYPNYCKNLDKKIHFFRNITATGEFYLEVSDLPPYALN